MIYTYRARKTPPANLLKVFSGTLEDVDVGNIEKCKGRTPERPHRDDRR